MKSEKTFRATIHVGLFNKDTGHTKDISVARSICQSYVNQKGDCVSFTPTDYVYTDGCEPGVIIEFIQYPRFPREEKVILERALELGELLRVALEQYKVSVICPERTYMIR